MLGEEPAWTHDIRGFAARIVERPEQVPAEVRAAVALLETIFGQARYPSGRADEPIPADLVGEDDARLAISSAEEVMAWVQRMLQ